MSDPENVFDLAGSYPVILRVKGILAPTGTADDGAIFVDVKTEWLILGIIHGHQDTATADPNLLISRDATNVTASAALLPFQEVTASNATLFHMHGDPATFPISAIIAAPRDDKSATILRGRYQDPKSLVQLLVPKTVSCRDARSGLSHKTVFRRTGNARRHGDGASALARGIAFFAAAARRNGHHVQNRVRADDDYLAAGNRGSDCCRRRHSDGRGAFLDGSCKISACPRLERTPRAQRSAFSRQRTRRNASPW